MKLPTDKLRQVIRLIHDESNTNRVIGITAGVSPNTVKNVRDLLRFNHKNWDDLKELDNETLDKILWGETKKPAIRWNNNSLRQSKFFLPNQLQPTITVNFSSILTELKMPGSNL